MQRLFITSVVAAFAVATAAGCKEDHGHPHDKPAAAPAGGSATAPASQPGNADHPNAVSIGSTTAGGMTLAATQDEPIKPGGDGAFDLKITGYPAGGKPKAVRFWVGVESGEGSAKAKAAEEGPDNWHTHVEVPNPMPAGGKFWAEVEPATGEKFTVSYDLK